jgi:hypothetical protein
MSIISLSEQNVENKKSRASKVVALAILSPAILAISGCGGSRQASTDCDNNRSTPQTSDDCNNGRSRIRSGAAAGIVGGALNNGANSATGRGGFGGTGGFFSGGG